MKQSPLPVIVCIDVEPDGPVTGRDCQPPWRGYEKARDFFSGMRPQIKAATGSSAHFSWFYRMDPQIAGIYGSGDWPVSAYPQYVREFEHSGDAIGLHTHLYRFETERSIWLNDNADPDWVRHCIDFSWRCFDKALNRCACLHRFGDRFLDSTALAALERAGCRCDLTPEPGFAEQPGSELAQLTTGALPDMRGVPHQPYRPSAHCFKQPAASGQGGLWLLPLSTGLAGGRLFGLVRKPQLYPLHLGLDCNLFSCIAARLMRTLEKPYIGIVLKTDMLLNAQLVEHMRCNLAFFRSHRTPARCVFTTPQEAMSILGYVV